jgi:hypothetical protein
LLSLAVPMRHCRAKRRSEVGEHAQRSLYLVAAACGQRPDDEPVELAELASATGRRLRARSVRKTRDARPSLGLEAIRDALQQFAALKPRLRGEITKVLIAGDVALVHNRWQLEGTQPDGSPVEMHGHSADVLRRASDGGWRILIDDPWGAGE